MELDFGFNVPDVGRLRCNAARQRGSMTMVIRLIKRNLPTFEQLGLPEVLKDLIMRPRGLVIVTGPTGSGKTTTLYSALSELNKVDCKALITADSFKTSDYVGMLRELAPELDTCAPGSLKAARLPSLAAVIRIGADERRGISPHRRAGRANRGRPAHAWLPHGQEHAQSRIDA